jgi:hypothetical protein
MSLMVGVPVLLCVVCMASHWGRVDGDSDGDL